MKKKDFIEMIDDIPDDYDICLSSYIRVTLEEDQIIKEDMDEDDYTFVIDAPIIAVATSDESKEIRLVIQGFDLAEEQDEIIKEL